MASKPYFNGQVALLAEGVDRNLKNIATKANGAVALLAEGVDRNTVVAAAQVSSAVALLAEGVDRNLKNPSRKGHRGGSPSSRRAWIEIR